MKKIATATVIIISLALVGAGCAGDNQSEDSEAREAVASDHMIAEAMLTAHFVAAALKAGMTTDEINDVLAQIAERTVIAEFWVSDETGGIAFTNLPGTDFVFPTDPNAGTQAAEFAALLTDDGPIAVVQGVMPRKLDSREFKYVGVPGVDQKRIVQVGVPGSIFEDDYRTD